MRFFGLAFLLFMVFVGITHLSRLLYPTNDIFKNWQSFYQQDRDSIECLFIGSSHAYSSFDTSVFEESLGMNSYVLASNSQNVCQAYFNVREVLKYQKPSVIVLEAFSFDGNSNWQNGDPTADTYDKDWKKESNIDGMRFGWNKLSAIKEQYTMKNWLYAFTRIARTHSNWKDLALIKGNWDFWRYSAKEYTGFRPSKSSMSEETKKVYEDMEESDGEFVISDVNMEYFHKLSELCREKGIRLFVVMAPMYDGYINKINYESRYQAVQELVQSEGLEYIDCNLLYDEIGLVAEDFEDAFSSIVHMNGDGARKVSLYVSERMKNL